MGEGQDRPPLQVDRRSASCPGAKADDVFNYYGMAVAYTMVDTLRKAGRNPTRASVLRAATHLNETNPFLLPGVRIQTSPNDYYPMDKVKLARYSGTHWQFFGKLRATAQGCRLNSVDGRPSV